MPCEGCHVQFTVFKRKRSCYDCKRFYCQSCLTVTKKPPHALCERCRLFNKRPLFRADLIKLKPKDLIFYLQSKHISTAGCVEKEELIDLVMQYVERTTAGIPNNQSSTTPSTSTSSSSSPQHESGNNTSAADNNGPATNSFDNIKQTCQNFFSSISDNISESISNLESRACSKQRPENNAANQDGGRRRSSNVTEQPTSRVTTREIPTYASFANSQQSSGQLPNRNITITTPPTTPRTPTQTPTSPQQQENQLNERNLPSPQHNPASYNQQISQNNQYEQSDLRHEECDCSDTDELIANFSGRVRSPRSTTEIQSPANDEPDNKEAAEDQETDAASTSAVKTKYPALYSKFGIIVNDDDSSHSSFEELGAIGGISDDSKTTTDTNSNATTTDQWQMLDIKSQEDNEPTSSSNDNTTTTTAAAAATAPTTATPATPTAATTTTATTTDDINTENPEESTTTAQLPPLSSSSNTSRQKKVTRRRSESYLNRKRPQNSVDNEDDDDDDDTAETNAKTRNQPNVLLRNLNTHFEEQHQSNSSISAAKKPCCNRCGKNKKNIRQQVEKMRRHLESSQMSETDIKQELHEFLIYLEQRTKSVDYSDSDAGLQSPRMTAMDELTRRQQYEAMPNDHPSQYAQLNGIRVTAGCSGAYTASGYIDKDSRFINLEDIATIQQLESLTVKQLKEILMLNRVDYKGCCEKQELFERVERLWKDLKSTPAVEKLPTDELCKICMDAPIECVILECGHMATCTSCGKVLSECPICRQYIVRVVRFFKA